MFIINGSYLLGGIMLLTNLNIINFILFAIIGFINIMFLSIMLLFVILQLIQENMNIIKILIEKLSCC